MRSTHDIEDEMLDALRTIRTHWAALLPLTVSSGQGGSKSADIVTGLDRRVSLADYTARKLRDWSELVVDERHIHNWLPLGTDVPGMVTFLERHARWLSGHDTGQDAASEWDDLAGRVRAVVEGPSSRRFVVSSCVEVEPADLGYPDWLDYNHQVCPGELLAVLRLGDALLPAAIHCSRNPEHTWQPRQWLMLGRRLGRDGDAA